MIKKFKIQLIIVLISNYCVAQDLILKCDNTQPRFGQTITISLQADFIDDLIFSSIPFKYETSKSRTVFGDKSFKKQIIIKDTGDFKIGPIEMTYNNKILKSNELQIKVLPALPQSDGIWIRYIDNNDKKYIVLEQNILVKIESKESNDEIVFQMDKLNDIPLAEIDVSTINGVSLKKISSNSSSKMVKNSQPFTNMIKSSITIYEIEESKENNLRISKNNMINLIDRLEFQEMTFDIK